MNSDEYIAIVSRLAVFTEAREYLLTNCTDSRSGTIKKKIEAEGPLGRFEVDKNRVVDVTNHLDLQIQELVNERNKFELVKKEEKKDVAVESQSTPSPEVPAAQVEPKAGKRRNAERGGRKKRVQQRPAAG